MSRNRVRLAAALVALTSVTVAVPAHSAAALGSLPGCPALAPSALPVSADAAERWIEHAARACTLPANADAAEHWLGQD